MLPEMCEVCRDWGGYWVEGRRCECARGQALKSADLLRSRPPVQDVEPKISVESAKAGVSMLSCMKYFPGEAGARLLIADELRSLCANEEQMIWLAKRLCGMYAEWPGMAILRVIFCSKYVPIDGKPSTCSAQLFPDGVPPEIEPQHERRALPAGTADPEFNAALIDLANRKRLN